MIESQKEEDWPLDEDLEKPSTWSSHHLPPKTASESKSLPRPYLWISKNEKIELWVRPITRIKLKKRLRLKKEETFEDEFLATRKDVGDGLKKRFEVFGCSVRWYREGYRSSSEFDCELDGGFCHCWNFDLWWLCL